MYMYIYMCVNMHICILYIREEWNCTHWDIGHFEAEIRRPCWQSLSQAFVAPFCLQPPSGNQPHALACPLATCAYQDGPHSPHARDFCIQSPGGTTITTILIATIIVTTTSAIVTITTTIFIITIILIMNCAPERSHDQWSRRGMRPAFTGTM